MPVDSIRKDFDRYQGINNDLQLQLLKKKKKLESIVANMKDTTMHLGCIGAKVSVNQKKLQLKEIEVTDFEGELEKFANITIQQYQDNIQRLCDLHLDMMTDIQDLKLTQQIIHASVDEIESTREFVLTSFQNFNTEKDELQSLYENCVKDKQVYLKLQSHDNNIVSTL